MSHWNADTIKSRTPEKPVRNDDDPSVQRHPSFGMITASRYSTTGQTLFGSAIKHHSGVTISISRASVRRNLSNDWYHGEERLIEVNLSENQFAQLITHMNQAPGTPCTIADLNITELNRIAAGEGYKRIPQQSENPARQKIEDEFKDAMKELGAQVEKLILQAKALKDKPSVSKSDRQVFISTAESVKSKIDSAVPYIQGQFNEAVEDVLIDAKADIEGFVSQLVRQMGLEAMQKRIALPDLTELMRPKTQATVLPSGAIVQAPIEEP